LCGEIFAPQKGEKIAKAGTDQPFDRVERESSSFQIQDLISFLRPLAPFCG
jgi:hypothetical protein